MLQVLPSIGRPDTGMRHILSRVRPFQNLRTHSYMLTVAATDLRLLPFLRLCHSERSEESPPRPHLRVGFVAAVLKLASPATSEPQFVAGSYDKVKHDDSTGVMNILWGRSGVLFGKVTCKKVDLTQTIPIPSPPTSQSSRVTNLKRTSFLFLPDAKLGGIH